MKKTLGLTLGFLGIYPKHLQADVLGIFYRSGVKRVTKKACFFEASKCLKHLQADVFGVKPTSSKKFFCRSGVKGRSLPELPELSGISKIDA